MGYKEEHMAKFSSIDSPVTELISYIIFQGTSFPIKSKSVSLKQKILIGNLGNSIIYQFIQKYSTIKNIL